MKNFFLFFSLSSLTLANVSADPCRWMTDGAHSKITVSVKSTADDFTATLTKFTAEIQGDTTGPAPVSSAKIGWDMANLETADAKRDKHLGEWFEPKGHPANSWTLTGFVTRDSKTFAKGKLSLHGVAKDVEFPVTLVRNAAGDLLVEGTATLDHRDFGLPKIRSFLVLTVDPVVTVSFHLEAHPSPAIPGAVKP